MSMSTRPFQSKFAWQHTQQFGSLLMRQFERSSCLRLVDHGRQKLLTGEQPGERRAFSLLLSILLRRTVRHRGSRITEESGASNLLSRSTVRYCIVGALCIVHCALCVVCCALCVVPRAHVPGVVIHALVPVNGQLNPSWVRSPSATST